MDVASFPARQNTPDRPPRYRDPGAGGRSGRRHPAPALRLIRGTSPERVGKTTVRICSMRRQLVLLLAAGLLAAGCAARPPAPFAPAAARACDDGGDGGVVIDGVCL